MNLVSGWNIYQDKVMLITPMVDCKYVENLVWFKKSSNNNALDQPSPYMASTKDILLLFKKASKASFYL
jgi:hypothetical protein